MITLKSPAYRTVEYSRATAMPKGELVLAAQLGGTCVGFNAFKDAEANEVVPLVIQADAVEVTKGAIAFAVGAPVYYDVGTGNANATNTNPLLGIAKRAAVAGDATVLVDFEGRMPFFRA